MATYSTIPAVDAAIRLFVREEDPPADPHAERDFEALRRAIAAADPCARVLPMAVPEYELSRAALAVKATRLVPGVLYAQLDVFVAGAAPLATLAWEWKGTAALREPTIGPAAPSERAAALEAAVRRVLGAAGLELVPFEEAQRVVRVDDDPHYNGAYYEIKVFEMLFGMGYPERQR
jgi:hypothetical protein